MSTTETERPIAPLDLAAERASFGNDLEEAVLRVLRSGQYVGGPEVEAFERNFAAYSGVDHAVAVSSGTDALVLGLRALGVQAGDRVLTSPFTFFASAGTVAWVGAMPRFADVSLETGLLDPAACASVVEDGTKCILPVHLYGQPCDGSGFRELADAHGCTLLEDGAQAHGARRESGGPGVQADACTYSFYPTKNLGGAGEAGLVTTRDADVAEGLRNLRDHGSAAKYRHGAVGTNARMDAIQAAVLNVKLPHLEGWNERRRELAAIYDGAFEGHERVLPLRTEEGVTHARHQYTVRITAGASRDDVLEGLKERSIFAAVHYPLPVHVQAAAQPWGYGPGDFPNAERLAEEVLCLPVHPFLENADAERVAAALLDCIVD